MSAATYRLRVLRELSGRICEYHEPEYPDVAPVSDDAFGLLARRGFRNEQTEATWYGGWCGDTHLVIGRALISERPALVAAADELLPLIRWCKVHTAQGDVCSLELIGGES
jgi:hypothetical protein